MARTHRAVWNILRLAALALLFLFSSPAGAARPVQAADDYTMELQVLRKPDHACVGKPATVAFAVDYSLLPTALSSLVPPPPIQLRAHTSLGTISPNHWSFPASDGWYFFHLQLTADNEGYAQIELTAQVDGESVSLGTIEIQVLYCVYHVTVIGKRNAIVAPLGSGTGESNNFYSAEGDFDLLLSHKGHIKPGTLIEGSGEAKMELLVTMKTKAAQCSTGPNPQGSAHFDIVGQVNAAGELELDFLFDPVELSGGIVHCTKLGSQPRVPSTYRLQTNNLLKVTLPLSGGQKEFTGAVTDTPPPKTTLQEDVSVNVRGK